VIGGIGRFFLFFIRIIRGLPYMFTHPRLLFQQVFKLGILSLPIVGFTSIFVGIVTALQTAYQMERGIPDYYIGSTAARIIMIELAPVVISLVVAGRVGSFIAAEIGTMRVTEQLDALESLAIDPVKYVCLPKVLAGLLILPLLVIISEAVAIASAGIATKPLLGVDIGTFIFGVRRFFYVRDLFGGLLKTIFFGLIIALTGTYFGMRTRLGAEGVGRSTTLAVVSASATILVFDFLVAFFVFK
jgi:phospholipid/cholesterol/gamma-HCH transport system permease protein